MNFEPPPKPMLHPNDNFRSCQMKMDAWYEDVKRIFKGAARIYGDFHGHWSVGIPDSTTKTQAWLLCAEPFEVEMTDEEMLAKIEDPIVRAAMAKRLNK